MIFVRDIMSLAFTALVAVSATAASFDCEKAATPVERMICADREISALDDRLGELFRSVSGQSSRGSLLKEEQRDWIGATRNRCSVVSCLRAAYELRIQELSAIEPNRPRDYLSCRYRGEGAYGDKVDVSMLITSEKVRIRWETWQYATGHFGCGLDTDDPDWKMDSDSGTYRFTNTKDAACTFMVKVKSDDAYFLAPIVHSPLATSIDACGCGQNGSYWDVRLERSTGKCFSRW